ncbi:MAG: hypothetical protein ACM3N9_06270 [Syntrophothermus sp.]
MPSSHHLQMNEIMDLVIRTRPDKLLDIGIGFGKYGYLSREYLELWDEKGFYGSRKYTIDGIEAFEAYVTPLHRLIYDDIFIGNALDVLPGLQKHYDLILLVDVFEHFTESEGWHLLDLCMQKADNIIISVPKDLSLQEDVFGNPFETHKYPWKEKDFKKIGNKFVLHNVKSLIVYIGRDSKRIGGEITKYHSKRRIIELMEFLHIKKLLKKLLVH